MSVSVTLQFLNQSKTSSALSSLMWDWNLIQGTVRRYCAQKYLKDCEYFENIERIVNILKILKGLWIFWSQADTKPVCAEYIDVTPVWETLLFVLLNTQYQPENLLFRHIVCSQTRWWYSNLIYLNPVWFGLVETHCGQLRFASSQAEEPGVSLNVHQPGRRRRGGMLGRGETIFSQFLLGGSIKIRGVGLWPAWAICRIAQK